METRDKLDAYDDLSKGDWIKIGQFWMLLDGSVPVPEESDQILGEYGAYGCDTGCMGYRIYLMKNGKEVRQLGDFHFSGASAITAAEKFSKELGCIPIRIQQDHGW